MAEDLGINVHEKIGIGEWLGGQSGEAIEFNAIGLLKVDVVTGETKIVVKQFIDRDKPGKVMIVRKGQNINLNFKIG